MKKFHIIQASLREISKWEYNFVFILTVESVRKTSYFSKRRWSLRKHGSTFAKYMNLLFATWADRKIINKNNKLNKYKYQTSAKTNNVNK